MAVNKRLWKIKKKYQKRESTFTRTSPASSPSGSKPAWTHSSRCRGPSKPPSPWISFTGSVSCELYPIV